MKLATGEYVAAAGSDDIQCPTKIEACIGHMESEPGTDMLFSDYEAIDENGKALGRGFWFPQEINNDNILDYELRRNYLLSGACVMKNVKEIEYDDNLRSSVDYDMFLSLLCKGFKFEYIRERMFKYRLHKANISLRHDKSALSYKYVLSKYRCQDLYPILRGKGIPEGHICNTFGIMCIHRDELSEAERHLLRGLSLNAANGTDLLDSHFYLATVYYASGKLEEAHAHLSEALRLCVREPTVLNNMGVLESRRGRRQAARRLFDEAVRISPLYVDAKCNNERVRAGQCADRFTKDMLRKEVVHSENMNG
jgi:Flp pilus assembly protein TadD